jgi:hypothetical protein
MIVPNKSCYPVLQDRPEPGHDELVTQANEKEHC